MIHSIYCIETIQKQINTGNIQMIIMLEHEINYSSGFGVSKIFFLKR